MKQKNELVIETYGLSKSYNGVRALTLLDLQVPKNSIFAFLGPNGAGKTTTIKLLLGLIRPTSGSGTIFRRDIIRDSTEIRKHIGYLAQHPRFYEDMTARETLRFAARFFYTGPKAEIEARITETLDLVGLENKADRSIKGLSGGELQRLGIAQAQINHPALLILDEPGAGLDPQGREEVLELMERLRKYATIFYSTHILDDVQRVSDTVAILNNGELIAQAPIEELLTGSGGVVYSLVTKGGVNGVYNRLVSQEWVVAINTEPLNGMIRWFVTVNDEEAAEAQLMRLMQQDERLIVTEFGRQEYELEEIFLRLVEESNNGH